MAFYGIALGDLLPEEPEPAAAHVVRAAERRHVYSPAEGIHMYLLAPDTKRKMMPVVTIYEPHGETAEFTSHPGEEFILVVEGIITLAFAGAETVVLQPGDSAYFFDSTTPHYLTNPGDTRNRSSPPPRSPRRPGVAKADSGVEGVLAGRHVPGRTRSSA